MVMNQSGSVHQTSSRTGQWFAWFAVIGMIVGLTAFFQVLTKSSNGITQVVTEDGHAMVVMERGRSGHYLAEGKINGLPLVFLIDTGATDVAIGEKTARTMGLEFGPLIRVMTAAGPTKAWVTRLDRVSLGSLELTNVRAIITPGLNDEGLLGMGFLKYFSLRQEGEKLSIESRRSSEINQYE
jgi:aspartyl protease family protein